MISCKSCDALVQYLGGTYRAVLPGHLMWPGSFFIRRCMINDQGVRRLVVAILNNAVSAAQVGDRRVLGEDQIADGLSVITWLRGDGLMWFEMLQIPILQPRFLAWLAFLEAALIRRLEMMDA